MKECLTSKIGFDWKKIFLALKAFSLLAALVVVVISLFFLKNNFYSKQKEFEDIINLRGITVSSSFNEKAISRAAEKIKEKTAGYCDVSEINDPFSR